MKELRNQQKELASLLEKMKKIKENSKMKLIVQQQVQITYGIK